MMICYADVQTLLQVRTLVVTAKPSTQSISKEQRSTAKKHQQHETRECPALFFDELFSLVCRFVSVSTGLYTLIFDQIGYFEGKHFRSFSLFLSKSKTGMKYLFNLIIIDFNVINDIFCVNSSKMALYSQV